LQSLIFLSKLIPTPKVN